MAYVSTAGSPEAACVFCAALESGDDRRALILHRGTLAFLILNAFPYASGHLMAVITRHVPSIEAATPAELAEAMTLIQTATRALTEVYHPDGLNVGLNQGRVAGAGALKPRAGAAVATGAALTEAGLAAGAEVTGAG